MDNRIGVACAGVLVIILALADAGVVGRLRRSGKLLVLSRTTTNRPITLVCIASLDNLDDDWRISVDEKAAYARAHGYGFELAPQLDTTRHPAWSKLIKVAALIPVVTPGTWFWVVDLDTVITNPNVKVSDFLPDSTTPQIVIGADCANMNSGSFFIRSSEWSRRYMEFMLSIPSNSSLREPSFWYEQAALVRTYQQQPRIARSIWIAPIYWFNAYAPDFSCRGGSGDPEWRPWQRNDLLIHFPGPGNKVAAMREYRSQVTPLGDDAEPAVSRAEIDRWWQYVPSNETIAS